MILQFTVLEDVESTHTFDVLLTRDFFALGWLGTQPLIPVNAKVVVRGLWLSFATVSVTRGEFIWLRT